MDTTTSEGCARASIATIELELYVYILKMLADK
jgi:hypothetical protein